MNFDMFINDLLKPIELHSKYKQYGKGQNSFTIFQSIIDEKDNDFRLFYYKYLNVNDRKYYEELSKKFNDDVFFNEEYESNINVLQGYVEQILYKKNVFDVL